MKNQHKGSSSSEFLVLAVVMVPAIAMIPILGKLSDSQQSLVEASRYAAWERTVSTESEKTDEDIATEVANRFFRQQDLSIQTDQLLLDEQTYAVPSWQSMNASGQTSALVNANADNLFLSTDNQDIPSGSGANIVADAVESISSLNSSLVSGAEWDLKADGFYVAKVGLNTESNNLVQKGVNCQGVESEDNAGCQRAQTAILAGSWQADSPDQVERRVKALVPSGSLQPIGEVLSQIGSDIFLLKELEKIDGMFGEVKPDVMLLDRYGDKE